MLSWQEQWSRPKNWGTNDNKITMDGVEAKNRHRLFMWIYMGICSNSMQDNVHVLEAVRVYFKADLTMVL